jgi:hypothetical protein
LMMTMSAPGGSTDLADTTADFREWPNADIGPLGLVPKNAYALVG